MPKKLKLMADYQCHPIWIAAEEGGFKNINPATLPLTQKTIERLQEWSNIYNSSLNLEDPHNSGFLNDQETTDFELEGILLWRRLREELGYDYEVSYFSELKQKEIFASEDCD
jgi:hypothetical protein